MTIREIEINTNTLGSDIDAMEQSVGQLEAEYNNMFQKLQELNGMWSGTANMVFREQFMGDLEVFQAMNRTLREIIAGLKTAKQEYDNCEQKVGGIVDTIRV